MDDRALVDWLLDADPALRWQVERDLVGAPEAIWQATRARVATEGFGAALLARQDPDGQWAGGAYFPAGFSWDGEEAAAGQPWTATTWSLNALREWGVEAAALGDTAARLEASSRWEYDDLPYWGGEVDVCINSWTLQNGLWLGRDMTANAEWLLEHQLPEGGWNCEWVEGSTRSSFPSTLNALDGLLAYEQATGSDRTVRARHAGEAFLLERRLHRRRRDGEPYWQEGLRQVAERFDQLYYPLRWTHTALHAADYLRRASTWDGTPPDPRAVEAIDLIRARRDRDGRWRTDHRLYGQQWFEVDVPAGEPSKWVTLHAMRILAWWDSASDPRPTG